MATPLWIQYFCSTLDGASIVNTKFVEWPVVESVPGNGKKARVRYKKVIPAEIIIVYIIYDAKEEWILGRVFGIDEPIQAR